MKKLRTLALSLLGVVAVAYLLLFLAVRMLLSPDQLKETITPKISQAIGREVTIDHIGISVFPGLSLNAQGVTIPNGNGFSDEPLLHVDDLFLNLKLLPLLRKRVEVASIRVDHPDILIEKSVTGKFNFEMAQDSKTAEGTSLTEEDTGPAMALVVNAASISAGRLRYFDHQSNDAVTINRFGQNIVLSLDEALRDVAVKGKIELSDIDLKSHQEDHPAMHFSSASIAHNLHIDTESKHIKIDQLQVTMESLQLAFAGSLQNYDSAPDIDLTLSTNEIELSNLMSILPPDLSPLLAELTGRGKIDLNLNVKGVLSAEQTPGVRGALSFNELTLKYADFPDKITNLTGRLNFTEQKLEIDKMTARLGENPLALNGTIDNFEQPRYDLKLKADLDLGVLPGYLASATVQDLVPKDKLTPLRKMSTTGKIKLNVDLRGQASENSSPEVAGNLSFNNLTLGYTELPDKMTNLNGGLAFTDKQIEFRNITAKLGDDPLALSGVLTDFEHPSYDLKLKTDLDLKAVKNYADLPEGMSVAGRLRADISARGRTDKPAATKLAGRIHVSNGSVTTADLAVPLTKVECEISLAGRTATISKLTLTAAKSSMAVTGRIVDPMEHPKARLQFTSSLLDLDELFPETEPSAGEEVTEPIKLPFETLDGKARISKLITNDMVLTDATADLTIRNNVLSISNLKSDLYSGKLTGTASADFNDPSGLAYKVKMKGEGLDVNKFATVSIPIKDALFGKMQLEMNASGTGMSAEEIKKNIVADGTTMVLDGKMVNLPVLNSLANFLNMPSFKEVDFRNLSNGFKIRDGKFSFDNFHIKALDNDISIAGFVGLDGSLDISIGMLLSETLTQRFHDKAVKVPRAFLSDSGRLPLDFIVKGSKDSQQIRWDMEKALSRAADRTIQKGLASGLEKLFGGKKETAKTERDTSVARDSLSGRQAVESSEDKKPADPLKSVLEGLFGKKNKKVKKPGEK